MSTAKFSDNFVIQTDPSQMLFCFQSSQQHNSTLNPNSNPSRLFCHQRLISCLNHFRNDNFLVWFYSCLPVVIGNLIRAPPQIFTPSYISFTTLQRSNYDRITCLNNVIVLVLNVVFNCIAPTPIHCLRNCVIILSGLFIDRFYDTSGTLMDQEANSDE